MLYLAQLENRLRRATESPALFLCDNICRICMCKWYPARSTLDQASHSEIVERMKIRIHRGTRQIGGTCIEVAAESAPGRIVLDLGLPLDADAESRASLMPDVPGLRDAGGDLLGVLISHPHQDHVGLVHDIHPEIPIGIGAAGQRILDRAADWLNRPKLEGRPLIHWQSGTPVVLGPFTITPLLVDHSAYDAYALLIEADGQRLFYSGDFRGHGRKAALFEKLLANPPRDIDVLMMEGTVIGRNGEGARFPDESDLENQFVAAFGGSEGLRLLWTSTQNIDRIVTAYRAAKRSGKRLVLDAFTAEMLAATENPKLPQAHWPGIGVYVPQWMRRRIVSDKTFEKLEPFRPNRVYLEQLDPSRDVLLFRDGMLKEVAAKAPLDGAQLIYSNWRGYLEEDKTRPVREWLAERAIPLHYIHTSGHASVPDLRRFAAALAPGKLVPIHSFHGDRFDELFANVDRRDDGEWFSAGSWGGTSWRS